MLAIGVVACLILMSAGVIFNPQTVEDIQAIGQSFQTHMYQWGTEAGKLDEVDEMFDGMNIIDPGDGYWRPDNTKIILARGLLAGISLWVSSVVLGLKKIEDTSQTAPLGFRYVNIGMQNLYWDDGSIQYFLNDAEKILSLLKAAYENKLAIVFCGTSDQLFGLFWKDGYLTSGLWNNPDEVLHASDFGVYALDSLNLIASFGTADVSSPVYFSKEIAESQPDFLTSDCWAIDWSSEDLTSAWLNNDFPAYRKQSYNSTWDFDTSFADTFYSNLMPETVYSPASESDVVWDQVAVIEPGMIVGDIVSDLESGELSDEEIPLQDIDYSLLFPAGHSPVQSLQNVVQQFYGGDMTLEKYLELTQTADSGAAQPSIVVNIPMGCELTYYQGASPSPITVLGSASDGGTISYEWYRYGTDANGKVYPVEVLDKDNSFIPYTSDLGTSHYYCRIINTDSSGLQNYVHTPSIKVSVVADPNVDTDPEPGTGTDSETNQELADKIGQSVSDAINNQNSQSNQDAMNTGTDGSKQLIDSIPNYSELFLPAVKNLADSLGYTGTTCILTMPAITVPAVGDLFPETCLLDEQQVNFEDYFQKIPSVLMTLTRALMDIAVVYFCLREFTGLISQVLTGFKERNDF